jgi:hypothetical protein
LGDKGESIANIINNCCVLVKFKKIVDFQSFIHLAQWMLFSQPADQYVKGGEGVMNTRLGCVKLRAEDI